MADEQTWWAGISNLLSGSFWALGGAFLGRAMKHGMEVKANRRRLFGWELAWDIPVVLGMWMISIGLQKKLNLDPNETAAIAVVLGHSGPRIIDAAVTKWMQK